MILHTKHTYLKFKILISNFVVRLKSTLAALRGLPCGLALGLPSFDPALFFPIFIDFYLQLINLLLTAVLIASAYAIQFDFFIYKYTFWLLSILVIVINAISICLKWNLSFLILNVYLQNLLSGKLVRLYSFCTYCFFITIFYYSEILYNNIFVLYHQLLMFLFLCVKNWTNQI